MGGSGGTSLERRRILVRGLRAGPVLAALVEAQGYQALEDEPPEGCDLVILEAEGPDDIPAGAVEGPLVVLTPRRLRAAEQEAFRARGAQRVLDSESSVLDLAFALSDLLFTTVCQQRRYARLHGGAVVRFAHCEAEAPGTRVGHLLCIARTGSYILSEDLVPEGTPVCLELMAAGRPIPLRGRVAFASAGEDLRGFGLEFALDDHEVAPKLSSLATWLAVPRRAVARSESTISA